jgi:GLPGLI family protein
MKSIFFITLFTLMVTVTAGQVPDSALIKVSYNFYFFPDSTNDNLKQDDLLIVEIGKHSTKCYSYYRQLRESLLNSQFSEQQKIDATKYSINMNGFSKNGTPTKFFKNLRTNIITVTEEIFLNSYQYKDSINDMKWRITEDTLTFLGYLCNKATTRFRGRNYNAWFTNEIPVSAGPFKFGGLPGLILLLKEDRGSFEFQCRSLEILKEKLPIVFEKRNYIKITRIEHRKLKVAYLENPEAFAASMGMTIETISCNGCPSPVMKKSPIVHLELE